MSQESRDRLRLSLAVVWAVVAIAAGILVVALPGAIRFLETAPSGFWAMAVGALIVDIPLFGLHSRDDLRIRSTLSVCFTFPIFVQFGAGPAILVQTLAAAITVVGQRYQPQAGVYLVARLICAPAAAELAVGLIDPRPVTTQGTGLNAGDLLAFTVLAAVWFLVSYGLLVVARATVRPRGLRQAATDIRRDLVGTIVTVLLVAPLLTTIPGAWTLLAAIPLLIWNTLYRQQVQREQQMGREPESGLLNRQGLVEGLRSVTAGDLIAPEGPRPFGLIVVNFGSVSDINRTLGREVYEEVVSVASRRLIDTYGANSAARLSGEAIAILIPDLTEQDALGEAATAVAVLDPVVEVDTVPFALDPAGGVALSPEHGRDLGTLLMKAELTADEARRTGERAALYLHRAEAEAEWRMTMLRELGTVIRDPGRHDEISILYQPQVDLATGRMTAVEALLRWNHPQWGTIPTDDLIAAIEPSEIMHMLTRHVLETVAAQVRRWNEEGEQFRVSVNVSVQDLHVPNFVEQIGDMVGRHCITPQQLVIEITERLLITDPERVSRAARVLASKGVGLSLDDFGTGYASLQQLRQLPLTEVKVDRSYVAGMVDNPADRAIVTSVHQLTRALGVDIVAEGVEDERIADALAKLPGTIGQGWHFGRPMTVDDFREWRRRNRSRRHGIRVDR